MHNSDKLVKLLRTRDAPVVTVANHHSCMDEPLLWPAILGVRDVWNHRLMRWALAAHDICFSNRIHAAFFAYGKSIPVVRGAGLQQPGVAFCAERLAHDNAWAHLYPEGRVNYEKRPMRLKWGVGHLVATAPKTPVLVPVYHLGMDDVLPMKRPYIPRLFKKVTCVVGEPIPVEGVLAEMRTKGASDEEIRIAITNLVEESFERLRIETEILHGKR